MNNEKKMILEDNLWRVCMKLSLPAVIAMVLFGLNVIFDAIFVGRYVGEKALAGVSIVYPLTQIPLGLGTLVGVGAGSYLSVLIGENNLEIQRKLMGNTNLIIIILGVLMTVLGLIFMNPLLKLMGAEGRVLDFAVDYFRVALFGSILWIGGIGYNMIVRAEGRMKTAAIMMGIGLLINVIANYIFIVIFDWGVKGAAWGTNIGMFVYMLLFWIYCIRGKASFETNAFTLRADKKIHQEIISLGFPSLLMSILSVIQGIIMLRALNVYGTTEDVAFYGVAFRLFNFFLTPIYGLMRALQPTVGINFGAKKMERVISSYKIYVVVSLLIMLPLWLISMIKPVMMLHLMLPEASFTKQEIFNYRILISLAPFLTIVLNAMTFYPAIKKPKPAAIIGLARQVFLFIPLMIILPMYFGIAAIYWGSFLIDAFLTLVIVIILRKEFKILRKEQVSESQLI